MKEKYVEEKFPRWFIHGRAVGDPIMVFISDGTNDFGPMPMPAAEALMHERNKSVDMLTRLAEALDWYSHGSLSRIWNDSELDHVKPPGGRIGGSHT